MGSGDMPHPRTKCQKVSPSPLQCSYQSQRHLWTSRATAAPSHQSAVGVQRKNKISITTALGEMGRTLKLRGKEQAPGLYTIPKIQTKMASKSSRFWDRPQDDWSHCHDSQKSIYLKLKIRLVTKLEILQLNKQSEK